MTRRSRRESVIRTGCPCFVAVAAFIFGLVSADVGLARTWSSKLEQMESRRDAIVTTLETVHAILLRRAAGHPELLSKLEPEPPSPRPEGHGILPEIQPDEGEEPVPLRSTRYALKTLHADLGELDASVSRLERRADQESRDLDALVTDYKKRVDRLENLESHLSYHAYWQQAVIDWRDWFSKRNEIVKDVRRLRGLLAADPESEEARVLREAIVSRLAPFQPPEGLRAEKTSEGGWRLEMVVLTDIADEAFRRSFRDEVHRVFNESDAARSLKFVLELEVRFVSADELEPGVDPVPGQLLDAKPYVKRFPAGSFVLTTGGESTHAFVGRYIQLGPAPLTSRTLVHEFSHLLGFNDAYLRGYEGDPDSGKGVVLVEWSGLADDLMGSSSHGRVTTAMLQRILDANRRAD